MPQDWRNITISVRWETYYYAREWAAQHDMSISAVVNRFLENLPYNSKYELPPPRKHSDPDPLTHLERLRQTAKALGPAFDK